VIGTSQYVLFEDFITGSGANSNSFTTVTNNQTAVYQSAWSVRQAGANAGLISDQSTVGDLPNAVGFFILSTGTAAAGRASLAKGWSSADTGQGVLYSTAVGSNGGTLDLTYRIRFTALATVAQNYRSHIGFMSTVTAATAGNFGNGAAFEYDLTGNASGNYFARVRNGTGTTVTNTGVAVAAGAWTTLRVLLTPSGVGNATAQFFINGVSVVTTTDANVPNVAADNFTMAAAIAKTAGGTTISLYGDYVQFTFTFQTAR